MIITCLTGIDIVAHALYQKHSRLANALPRRIAVLNIGWNNKPKIDPRTLLEHTKSESSCSSFTNASTWLMQLNTWFVIQLFAMCYIWHSSSRTEQISDPHLIRSTLPNCAHRSHNSFQSHGSKMKHNTKQSLWQVIG